MGRVTGSVTRMRQGWFRRKPLRDHSDVVVYLEGVRGPPLAPPSEAHEIRQVNKQFVPAVSAVVVGTTIDFPNDDKFFHNVFSLSQTAPFDLGLYKSGTSKVVTVERTGVVNVYCNIHPNMAASVLVLENRHFAVTGRDGTFSLEGVPAGNYPIVAWQPRGEIYRGEVTIRPGSPANVAIELLIDRSTTHHTRKDGTPYGRYR
ncbi:MAG: carboxypeptidase regulatory-like domain-containing protein [Nannocystaceae bacterium]